MLRESIKQTGEQFDMAALSGAHRDSGTVPHEDLLIAMADAVTLRDATLRDSLPARFADAMGTPTGQAAFVDAAAIAAAFQGFNRIADSVGTEVDPQQESMLDPVREDIGIDAFYRSAR